MIKFNYKSRNGFTLIELLVVIGILAVLAAIAIPSVAGLIDRANVSADKTNANEMTNAIERFTSEYELYCQDIASGVIKADTTDFDSAQGRVYNVTKVKTRAGVETLEVAQDAVVADDQIAIYRDTKYPANAKTMQAVVENYTKTSSSTFEPKQSDMHYWYSPDCGVVVFDEPDASVEDLNAQIQSGMDAKGNTLDADTQWIDITLGTALSGGASLDMSTVDSTLANNDWATIQAVIRAGKVTEAGWQAGDLSPEFQINGQTNRAKLVDINANNATFMLVNSIGQHCMNNSKTNIGGYANSEMKNWLNTTVHNSIDADLKAVIKQTEVVCVGNSGNIGTTSCYLFVPSTKELNMHEWFQCGYNEPYRDAVLAEGEVFDLFIGIGENYSDYFDSHEFMLRTPWIDDPGQSQFLAYAYGMACNYEADNAVDVYPAFVIG